MYVFIGRVCIIFNFFRPHYNNIIIIKKYCKHYCYVLHPPRCDYVYTSKLLFDLRGKVLIRVAIYPPPLPSHNVSLSYFTSGVTMWWWIYDDPMYNCVEGDWCNINCSRQFKGEGRDLYKNKLILRYLKTRRNQTQINDVCYARACAETLTSSPEFAAV